MTINTDSIQVRRIDLLEARLEGDLATAFEDYTAIHHEFGVEWLHNLASTALPANERAYIYVASVTHTDYVALPLKLNLQTAEASALTNYYSSLYSPIVRSVNARCLFTAVFKYLAKTERINAFTLSPLDAQSEVFTDLQTSLQAAHWKGVHTWPCFTNWTHSLVDNSYQTYLSSLPSKVRNTVGRKSRKFLLDGRGKLSLVTDSETLASANEQYQRVYQHSWKNEEPHPAFIPGLMELAARKGWLRLGFASYDGVPVAAQLWLVVNGTAYIFKLAYDENYRHLSPGTVLTAYLMEQVISVDEVTSIDYLTGDDAYKRDWMSASRVRLGIAAYNPTTPGGLASLALHGFRQFAKILMPNSR